MYAYFGKTGQISMLSQSKIEAPNFKEIEIDETDQAVVDQRTKGGQLYIKNDKIEWTPIQTAPIDQNKAMTDALAESKDFADFKKKLSKKLL